MAVLALVFLFQFSVGDTLFFEKDFFNAITEYKRELFRGTEDSLYLLRKIALCYLKRNKIDEALQYYSELYYYSENINIRHIYALTLIKAGKYFEAVELLEGLKDSLSLLLKAISLGLEGLYDSSIPLLKTLNYAVPDFLMKEKQYIVYSRIIPGSGLLLLKEVPLAFGVLSFTGGAIYLTYYYLRRRLYYEAIASAVPLVLRFYNGGVWDTRSKFKQKAQNYYKILLRDIENNLIIQEESLLFNRR
ncbi:MAG: CDC27 family protein [Candidatus Hydrothermia bacterium]